MKIWILTDDRVGSNNQSIALGEKLSSESEIKKISHNKFAFVPNFLKGTSKIGTNFVDKEEFKNGYPDILIFAGRRLASLALYIKKKSKNKTFVIGIMNPNLCYKKFNILLLPKHDNTSYLVLKNNPNIIETIGALNRINAKKVEDEKNKWLPELSKLPSPYFSLIIGGDTKDIKFDAIEFGKMTKQLSDFVKKAKGTLLITTSRRTSNECLEELKNNLNCKFYLYDWIAENKKPDNEKNPLGNPYFAYMGIANYIIVTGDSMSMISESCSTGKPVYVYMPDSSIGKKHKRFCEQMIKQGYVKELTKDLKSFEDYVYEPLNEVDRISKIIKGKL